MKRMFITMLAVLAVCTMLLPSSTLAGLSAGPKLGVNYDGVSGTDSGGTKTKIGAAVGGYLAYSFSDLIAIQPELLYTMKGFLNENDKAWNLNYLEVPILAKFSFLEGNVRPIVFVGPAVGILLSADFDGTSDVSYNGQNMKFADLLATTDFGALIGAGAEFGLGTGKLTVDLRFDQGLTTIASDKFKNSKGETAVIANRVISLMVGYLFSL